MVDGARVTLVLIFAAAFLASLMYTLITFVPFWAGCIFWGTFILLCISLAALGD